MIKAKCRGQWYGWSRLGEFHTCVVLDNRTREPIFGTKAIGKTRDEAFLKAQEDMLAQKRNTEKPLNQTGIPA